MASLRLCVWLRFNGQKKKWDEGVRETTEEIGVLSREVLRSNLLELVAMSQTHMRSRTQRNVSFGNSCLPSMVRFDNIFEVVALP